MFLLAFTHHKAIEDAITLCKVQLRKYIFPFYDINYAKAAEDDEQEKQKEEDEEMEVEEYGRTGILISHL